MILPFATSTVILEPEADRLPPLPLDLSVTFSASWPHLGTAWARRQHRDARESFGYSDYGGED